MNLSEKMSVVAANFSLHFQLYYFIILSIYIIVSVRVCVCKVTPKEGEAVQSKA